MADVNCGSTAGSGAGWCRLLQAGQAADQKGEGEAWWEGSRRQQVR